MQNELFKKNYEAQEQIYVDSQNVSKQTKSSKIGE